MKVDDDAPYPIANDTISLCQTLDWYSHNINFSFASNTRMVFLNGTHYLETFIMTVEEH